jgi:hypothetical protein
VNFKFKHYENPLISWHQVQQEERRELPVEHQELVAAVALEEVPQKRYW